MKIISLILLGSLSLTAQAADIQPTTPESQANKTSANAKTLKRIQPIYPKSAEHEGYEGWVQLSYVIGTDGNVSDAFVVDSSGLRDFEKAALKALKKWTFTPATNNGEKIVQCKNNIQMDFSMNQQNPRTSRKFKINYDDTASALKAKDLVASKTLLDRIAQTPRHSSIEEAYFWQLNAHYYRLTGDVDQQLKSFEHSAGNIRDKKLKTSMLLPSLQNIFLLQVQTNQLSKALVTYDKITKLEKNNQVLEQIEPFKAKIDELLASDKLLVVPQKVGERGFSQYRLARNSFQFDEVEGDLSKLSIYCDNQHEEFAFNANNVWTIPQSWGQCSVYVYGDSNTSFNIIELPDQA